MADDPDVVEWDGGLRLRGTSLWLDARRPVSLSFVSSALAFRPHQRLITSATTVQLLGGERGLGASDALASPFGRRFSVGELVLELVPAGHVVGGAMLLVRHRGVSLLYAGGVRPGPAWLGEPAQVPRADVLMLDCPYDAKAYAFPERARVARALTEWVRAVIAEGGRPVLRAAALGTAQELCHLLASEVFGPRVDRAVSRWNARVRACGVPLGPAPELRRELAAGEVAVVSCGEPGLAAIRRHAAGARVALVSGRAAIPGEVAAAGAEVGFALSSHADAAALRRLVTDTGATHVYLGPRHSAAFEAALRRRHKGLGVTRFAPPPGADQLELDLS